MHIPLLDNTGEKDTSTMFITEERFTYFLEKLQIYLTEMFKADGKISQNQLFKELFYAGWHKDEAEAFMLGVLAAQLTIALTGENPMQIVKEVKKKNE